MTDNILFFHNILRYFVLLFLVIVVIQSLIGMLAKSDFKKIHKTGALILMIIFDMQLLIGIIVYMKNGWLTNMGTTGAMKNHVYRFFGLEHPLVMLIAMILVHVAYAIIKKNIPNQKKFVTLFWCSVIALFLVLARIPWPGMKEVGRPFFPTTTQPVQ